MKEFIPQIRVISVDHDRTSIAHTRLRHAMDRHNMKQYQVRSVFCHLESGRCGVESGKVAIEVDGLIIWKGKELTEDLAEQFCVGLPRFIEQRKQEYGIS